MMCDHHYTTQTVPVAIYLTPKMFPRFSETILYVQMGWLKEEGFGGIMIWSVDMDDFRGQCGTGKYPLINAMRQELEDYTVKLEYDGPFESSSPGGGAYTTKDRKYCTYIARNISSILVYYLCHEMNGYLF